MGGYFKMRGQGFARLAATASGRPAGEAVGKLVEGIESFAADALGGGRPQVGGRVGDAQRLGAWRILEKAHDAEQLRRGLRGQGLHAHQAGADIAGAFAAVIIDLQVIAFLTANFQTVALPEHGLLGR